MSKEKPFHETVADKLLAQLEAGTSPFQKTGKDASGLDFQIPFNPSTGKAYRGTNALWLAMQSQADPRWLTMRQANIIGAKVPKGTKGTPISFLAEKEGQLVPQTAWVFNAAQLKNMPTLAESLKKLTAEKAKQEAGKALGADRVPAKDPGAEQLVKGDQISYKESTIKVVDVLKNGSAKIENVATGEKTKLKKGDGMYLSLLQAKQVPEAKINVTAGKDQSVQAGPAVSAGAGLAEPELRERSGLKR